MNSIYLHDSFTIIWKKYLSLAKFHNFGSYINHSIDFRNCISEFNLENSIVTNYLPYINLEQFDLILQPDPFIFNHFHWSSCIQLLPQKRIYLQRITCSLPLDCYFLIIVRFFWSVFVVLYRDYIDYQACKSHKRFVYTCLTEIKFIFMYFKDYRSRANIRSIA